jgi:hypothetical protein
MMAECLIINNEFRLIWIEVDMRPFLKKGRIDPKKPFWQETRRELLLDA